MVIQTWYSLGITDVVEWNDGVVVYQHDSGMTHHLVGVSGDLVKYCCSGMPFCLNDLEGVVKEYAVDFQQDLQQCLKTFVNVLVTKNLIESNT